MEREPTDAEFVVIHDPRPDLRTKPPFDWRRFWWGPPQPDIRDSWTEEQWIAWLAAPWWRRYKLVLAPGTLELALISGALAGAAALARMSH